MTKQDQQELLAGRDAINWLQDQVHQHKAANARLQQQVEQLQNMILDLAEQSRRLEDSLRELNARTLPLLTAQEETRRLEGVLHELSERQSGLTGRVEHIERQRLEDAERVRADHTEVMHRVQDLEREEESWLERQTALEDAGRRFQESAARVALQVQQVTDVVESAEGKAARAVESANRVDHAIGELENTVVALQRADEALAERLRLAHEIVHRVEGTVLSRQDEVKQVPLLAERLELLRTERQRLEDRTGKLEQALSDLGSRLGRDEALTTRQDGQLRNQGDQLTALHQELIDQRRLVADAFLKASQTQERARRRQIEEMEREIKELKQHAAGLTVEE